MRFLFNLLATALALPYYLEWSRAQAEEQIDEMQRAAFNTPGAESPVTPAVILGGMGLLFGHFALARLLGLRFWQAVLYAGWRHSRRHWPLSGPSRTGRP